MTKVSKQEKHPALATATTAITKVKANNLKITFISHSALRLGVTWFNRRWSNYMENKVSVKMTSYLQTIETAAFHPTIPPGLKRHMSLICKTTSPRCCSSFLGASRRRAGLWREPGHWGASCCHGHLYVRPHVRRIGFNRSPAALNCSLLVSSRSCACAGRVVGWDTDDLRA